MIDKPMTPQERKDAEDYALAIGFNDVENMSDDRLRRLMQSIADDCEKYGSD